MFQIQNIHSELIHFLFDPAPPCLSVCLANDIITQRDKAQALYCLLLSSRCQMELSWVSCMVLSSNKHLDAQSFTLPPHLNSSFKISKLSPCFYF